MIFSPEAVRRAMIELRRWGEGTLSQFNRRLAIAQKELRPRNVIRLLMTDAAIEDAVPHVVFRSRSMPTATLGPARAGSLETNSRSTNDNH